MSDEADTPIIVDPAKPKRTTEEQALLDNMAKDRGQEWVDRNAESIPGQARSLGYL
jgi:hypothetical protein